MVQLNAPAGQADPATALNLRILKLERRLQRERAARIEAEEIAERGLRQLYDKQQQLGLLETIATEANRSASVDDTLRFAVVEICRYTNWSFGNVFKLAPAGPVRLLASPIWHADDTERLAPFVEVTQATVLAPGAGLPGRVLGSASAAWIPDLAADGNFPRAPHALACGLSAGFAFPVLVGRDVVAVMEFYSREAMAPDQPLLAVMAQIGTQLGRVIERKRAEEQLIHDASHDPLTGLPNRLLFLDRLGRAVARRRRGGGDYAVLFIDLDRFKLVNDSLGHAAGDRLLIEIGRRLAEVLDAEGGCGEGGGEDEGEGGAHTLARLGGDEFTVLLEEIAHPGIAMEVAGRLQSALKLPLTIEGQEIYTTASIGVASSVTDYAGAADIMRDADLAMYRAKALGRARAEIYDESLHALAVARLKMESDLRRALHNRDFVLHYQPIVALDSREVIGFEALVRWQRAPGEMVSPGDFIGVAEETGLIVFLGGWVMREACKTMARWQREHPRAVPLTISINVSPRQFLQPDFVDQVRMAVTGSGVAPGTVRLEITESVTIQDAERTIEILNELHGFGVRVGIDDFGTGYSSLSYLRRLPFDVLKIDRSFVAALNQNDEGREIVQTILDLARNLNMDVVAEGTESAAHVDQLHAMGCQFAQGYFFSRPLDAAAAGSLLADAFIQAD